MRAVTIRRVVGLLAVLFVAVPLLASCGGDDEPADDEGRSPSSATSASAEASDPSDPSDASGDAACDLVTTDEVAAAVGTAVGDGVPSDSTVATGGTQTTCTWVGAEDPATTATLTVYTEASAADSVREDDSTPLPDVGDDAFEGPYASVWAYAGDGSFTTQWFDFDATDEENLPKSTALALLVRDRL